MLTRIVAALMSIIMFGAAIIPMEANEETYLVVTAPSTDEMFKIDGTVDTQALLLKAEIQATKSSPNTGLMPLYLTNTFFSFGVLPDISLRAQRTKLRAQRTKLRTLTRRQPSKRQPVLFSPERRAKSSDSLMSYALQRISIILRLSKR